MCILPNTNAEPVYWCIPSFGPSSVRFLHLPAQPDLFYLRRTSFAVKITRTITTLSARLFNSWTVSVEAPQGVWACWGSTSMRRMWPWLTKLWRVWLSTAKVPAMKIRYWPRPHQRGKPGTECCHFNCLSFLSRIVLPLTSPMALILLLPWSLMTLTHLGRNVWTWCWNSRWVKCRKELALVLKLGMDFSGFDFGPDIRISAGCAVGSFFAGRNFTHRLQLLRLLFT